MNEERVSFCACAGQATRYADERFDTRLFQSTDHGAHWQRTGPTVQGLAAVLAPTGSRRAVLITGGGSEAAHLVDIEAE